MSQAFTQRVFKANKIVAPFFGCVKAYTSMVLVIEPSISGTLSNTVSTKLN